MPARSRSSRAWSGSHTKRVIKEFGSKNYSKFLIAATRADDGIGIMDRQRRDPLAVALEADRRARPAGGVERELPLMKQRALDCAGARDRQLAVLRRDDEVVARAIAEGVASRERSAVGVGQRLVAIRLVGAAERVEVLDDSGR